MGDVTAGVIVSTLLVPQSMAYAMLAGLPPQIGLYASILPPILYALLGTSRALAVGPVAVVSLIVNLGVSKLATENTPEYLSLVLVLTLLVGIIQVLVGSLRLGFLINFLSHSVVSGFTSAAAIIIGFSQTKDLLGIEIPQTELFYQLLFYLAKAIPETNLVTLGLGTGSIVVLLYFNKVLVKQLKDLGWSDEVITPIAKSRPLLVAVVSSLLVWGLRLERTADVKVVGSIPAGLPPPTLPILDWHNLQPLLLIALTISFVGFMESFAVAQSLASKRHQKVDANQELIALGMANLGASLTSGYPVTGAFSRSVVNFEAGANTRLASVVTAIMIALTTMFFTSLFKFLPQASLAAVILVAVSGLIDLKTFNQLWSYDKTDAMALMATSVAVLVIGVELGIITGAIIALVLHLWRTSRPNIVIVGQVEGTEHFRNVLQYSVKTCPNILAIRVDESLYFANAKYLEDYLLKSVAAHPEVKHVVLICSAINSVDASALSTLEFLIAEFKSREISFYLSEVKSTVMQQLKKSSLVEILGNEHIFLTTYQAMCSLGCVCEGETVPIQQPIT